MDDLTDSLRALFSTPFCPTCATLFDPERYDDVDDCATCSSCGTSYKIGAEYRPPHPEDRLEYGLLDDAETAALEQFRTDAEKLADKTARFTAGASYELYVLRFSEACAPLIEALDPSLRKAATDVARYHGYYGEHEESEAGFGPGCCPLSGIEEEYCHCGRHP